MIESRDVIATYDLTKAFRVKSKPVKTGLGPFFTKLFKRLSFVAVDHVNFSVRKGEIFGLVGPNGAGKTTLLKMLCTLIMPTEGIAFVNGYNVQKNEGEIKASIGYADCSERSLYWRLTGEENLEFFARLTGMPSRVFKTRIGELLELLGMEEDKAREKVMYYSHGMIQKIILARCLLRNPSILILDEPTVGLDPLAAHELRELIRRLNREERKTVLVSSHNIWEIEKLCDRVVLMIGGKLLAIDTPENYRRVFGALDKGVTFEDAILHYLGVDYSKPSLTIKENDEKNWSTFQFPAQDDLRRQINSLVRESLQLKGKIHLNVEGDSMLPIMGNGQKVEVTSTRPEDIEIGDIVFFEEGDYTLTHRVINIEKRKGKWVFTTKGDASFIEDKPLHEDKVIGKVVNLVSGPQLRVHPKDLIRQTSEANGVNAEFLSRNLASLHKTVNTDLFEDFRKVSMDDVAKAIIGLNERNPRVNLKLGKDLVRIESDIRFNTSLDKLFQLRLDLWKRIRWINRAAADFLNLLLKSVGP